jgi:hypothetical protein
VVAARREHLLGRGENQLAALGRGHAAASDRSGHRLILTIPGVPRGSE